MWRAVAARIKQKYRTMPYPNGPAPVMPDRFLGQPAIATDVSPEARRACRDACPTGALTETDGVLRLDVGRCIFCGACRGAAGGTRGAVTFNRDFRLAAARRDALIVSGHEPATPPALVPEAQRLFGRSLKLRQVSAGGCNACEADTNVLGTLAWDLGRFGIQFVASPRHADGLLVTGPVSRHMELALLKTYEATPAPKIVIAVGACAVSGGIYRGHAETHKGVDEVIPVDVYVPGCPPHPATILDGLLRLSGRIDVDAIQSAKPRCAARSSRRTPTAP